MKATYMSSINVVTLGSFIENLMLLILSENFILLLVFTVFKKPIRHYFAVLEFISYHPTSFWKAHFDDILFICIVVVVI